MTTELMEKGFTRAEKKAHWPTPASCCSPREYSDRALSDHPRADRGRPQPPAARRRGIDTGCPVTILQGGKDPDVPKEHALRLAQHFLTDPVTVTLIPDGDHRLAGPGSGPGAVHARRSSAN